MHRVLRAAAAITLLGSWASLAHAVGGVVNDGPVSLTLPSNHWLALPGPANFVGTDAGGDVLYASSWWYRLTSGDTREHRMPPPDTETYGGGAIELHWDDVDGRGFTADETIWILDNEGPSGSFHSRMRISSLVGDLDLTFFHYLDLVVGGTFGGDSGVQMTSRYMKFTDGASTVRYRASVSATAYEVRPYASGSTLLDKLTDADVDTLDSTGLPFGPADPTAAYQFDASLFGSGVRFLEVTVSSNLAWDSVKGEVHVPGTGYPELLFQQDDSYKGWLMRRTGYFSSYGGSLGADEWLAGCDDFDGDYDSEYVTHNQVSGQLTVGYDPASGAPPLPPAWQVAATGDLDGNGKADVLWRNTSTQKLAVWLMDGSVKVGDRVPTPDQAVHANWEVVGLADFDDDGLRDFLWYNQTTGRLVIWYMDAGLVRLSGGFTNPASVGNRNWKALAVGDFGRGPAGLWATPDIVWQNDTSMKLVVWFMDLSGNRTSGIFTTPDSAGPWRLAGPR